MGTCTSEEKAKKKGKQNKTTNTKEIVRTSRTMNENSMKTTIDECFDRFDRNHDGFLDFYEVVGLVRHSYDQSGQTKGRQSNEEYRSHARNLMKNLNLEDESRINREEFYKFYKNF